jgi:GlcNAc-P-P-Und epimerase
MLFRVSTTVIFGGAGFIGRHLTAALASDGAEILIADVTQPRWTRPVNARFVYCDVRQPIGDLGGAKPELVVNLAAVHRTPGHDDHEYFEANEGGARNVTDFCRAKDVSRLWFTSSIAVYGPSEASTEESSPLSPTSAYGKSKVRAEEIHSAWAEETPDRRLVVVRPATVFGPGEGGNFTRLAKALHRRTFVYPGRRTTRKACGYVEDLVGSLLYMEAFAAPTITYNFGYPTPPTTEEIVDAFVRVAGYPKPLGTVPLGPVLRVGRVLKALGMKSFDPERIVKLAHSTNVIPRQLIDKNYPYRTDFVTALEQWYRDEPAGTFD